MALDVEAFPVATSRAHQEAASVPQAGTWLVCLMAHEDDGWRIVERLARDPFRDDAEAASRALDGIEADLVALAAADGHGRWMLSIAAIADDGFDIELYVDARGVRASFGGLEQDFAEVPEAMRWVRRALSGAYRLRAISIDGRPCEWSLEPSLGLGGPHRGLVAGRHRLFSRFRTKTLSFRSNWLLPAPSFS